jgi:hypothetical protein
LVVIILAVFVFDSNLLRGLATVLLVAAAVPQVSARIRQARQRGASFARITVAVAVRFLLGAVLAPATLLVTTPGLLPRLLGIALFLFIVVAGALLWRTRWPISSEASEQSKHGASA